MNKKLFSLTLVTLCTLSASAQENKKQSDSSSSNQEAQSMLRNASSADQPREINIGLPADLGGATILENGMPVTYDFQSISPTRVWRQDGSFSKVQSLNIYKTAIKNGSIGVAMSTESGKGTDKFGAVAGFTTNTFGLVRFNGKISGPLNAKGWTYQISAFLNYDPTSQRLEFSRFNDQTQIFRAFVNKKYKSGEIGIQYKFAENKGVANWNINPYVYHSNGKVSEYNGMKIGTTMYAERTGMAHPYNVWTGNQEHYSLLDNTGSTAHVLDVIGNHFFSTKTKLHYAARFMYANSGFVNPNYGTIFNTADQGANNRYVYQANPSLVYDGMVQKGQMAVADKWGKTSLDLRAELSGKAERHDWLVGLSLDGMDAHDAYRSVYGWYTTVENNPSALVHQKLVNGTWTNSSDVYGDENPNSAIQYYDGLDSKVALYATDKWNITPKFTAEVGVRGELQHIDGYWAPKECRGKNSNGITVLTSRNKLQKDWGHFSGTLNLVWNAFKGGGFTADAMFAQVGGNLSGYAQAADPDLKTSNTIVGSVGFYYNSPKFDITSKVNYITRSNYSFAGNFENPNDVTEITRLTVKYGVQTLGWTTDLNWRPFKGFAFHYLLTLQDPKYKDFDFEAFGLPFSFSDGTVRNVSKVLMEIDPSYTFGKWRIWASARYYSKMYANFSDALYFAARWETFGGLSYKANKNIDFSINVINFLNQTGAQGNIAGANTITKEAASQYYDKPLACTYIRPFQIEFKTTFRF